ncbi:MAG: Lar family restriction alleviation protein [Clostridia bacterium]|nr:Lar family restriction alleviation protein [Clostridia bacterium]MBQ9401511.1 Lar family restriction alleviation protein [Clostridia bacterium]
MMEDVERVMKPCPFCGGKAVMIVKENAVTHGKYFPSCGNRNCIGRNKTKYFYSVLTAVVKWNERKEGDGVGI